MLRKSLLFAAVGGAGLAIGLALAALDKADRHTRYLRTREPLLLSAGEAGRTPYLLPPGTPLYEVQDLADGRTVYLLYLSVKGDFDHAEETSGYARYIEPIRGRRLKRTDAVAVPGH